MSTITVTNIKATGETASRAVSGVAAAWVNFNGNGTIATRDSINVSSLTDIGTGNYAVNLSNNMNNVNYCVTGGTGYAYANSGARDSNCQPYDFTTSLFDLSVGVLNSSGASARDHGIITASAHGDLV